MPFPGSSPGCTEQGSPPPQSFADLSAADMLLSFADTNSNETIAVDVSVSIDGSWLTDCSLLPASSVDVSESGPSNRDHAMSLTPHKLGVPHIPAIDHAAAQALVQLKSPDAS